MAEPSRPGSDTPRSNTQAAVEFLADSGSLAAEMPDLLVQAHELATTIIVGQHGRRRAGTGEDFWQYRAFFPGETASMIDWRRSARDDHLFVREHEWEAAHTVWLWVDTSLSMNFSSDPALRTKRARALILSLALSECLARGGERIGIPALLPAKAGRTRTRRVAEALLAAEPAALPATSGVGRYSDLVIFGDFLDNEQQTLQELQTIAATGARAHLVQVVDPIEETFPFRGRTEFTEPETGRKLILGRADTLAEAYQERLARLRDQLRTFVGPLGWSFVVHRTDRSAIAALAPLVARLADRPEIAAVAREGVS